MIEVHKLLVKKIEEDKTTNFILWHVESEDRKLDTYFLFGISPNCSSSNFSIQATKKWSREKKIEFFKNLYLNESNESLLKPDPIILYGPLNRQ